MGDCVSKLPKTTYHCGKTVMYEVEHTWTKQSIFWKIPCWSELLIHHNLDVMHIEKNVCEQIIYTTIRAKTKDDVNARRDLAKHCKCQKSHVQATEMTMGEE